MSERLDKLRKAAKLINETYAKVGEKPVFFMGSELDPPPRIPSGSITLDWAWGGGVIAGMPNLLWGPESIGKTSLSLRIIAYNQARDPEFVALWLDGSGSLNGMLNYARTLGVDLDRIFPVEVSTLEEAVEVFRQVANEGLIDMLVVDDLAVYSTIKEQYKGAFKLGRSTEHAMTDQAMATQAAANNTFIRRTKHLIKTQNIALLYTQQVRDSFESYGDEFVLGGGRGFKHALRLNTLMQRGAKIHHPTRGSLTGDNPEFVGYALKLKIMKMAIDGAQPTGTEVLTQWTSLKGIERGRDAFMFLNQTLGLIETHGSSRLFMDGLCEKLGVDKKTGFSTRARTEAWLEEHYDLVYQAFVPNLALQPKPGPKVTKEKVSKAVKKAKNLLHDPKLQQAEETEEKEIEA